MNFSKLTQFLHHLVDEVYIPSVCMQVYRDGVQVYSHAYGCPEGMPVTPDTTYNLYSVSKVITCTAALQLLEEGKYLLTDPLYEYFPQFREMYVRCGGGEDVGNRVAQGERILYEDGKTEAVRAKNPIRIRDLFNMTAGFSYNYNAPAFKRILAETGGRFPTLRLADALASEPLEYEPGTRWGYSLAHDMIGALIEKISGIPFGEYLRKNIFEPLDMKSFTFHRDEAVYANMAPQYLYNYETKRPALGTKENPMLIGEGFESGGAGLIGSVADYAKFANAMCLGGTSPQGARILSRATIDLMRTNFLTAEMAPYFNWEQFVGYGYGLGVRTHVSHAKSGGLSPLGEFGWGGAAGAYVLIDPDNRVAAFYGQHMRNNLEPYVHPRLRNIVYGCL